MEVFECGTRVLIGLGMERIPALVTAVSIRYAHVQYEVNWWDGRTHHCRWMEADEIVPTAETTKTKIGFAQ